MFPAWLRDDHVGNNEDTSRRPNLSGTAQHYLDRLDATVNDLFHHVLAVLHDPAYREANAGALRMEWPRIPVPGWPDGTAEGAAQALAQSAARGRELARLLDSDMPAPGVTSGSLRPETAATAVPATTDGRNMTGGDFALTAGWGHYGTGGAVMPGQGRIVERAFTPEERAAVDDALSALGQTTFDVYLNGRAFWRNVPRRRLALQARRLSGPQEVALLPRTSRPRTPALPAGSPALHRHGKTDRGDIIDCGLNAPSQPSAKARNSREQQRGRERYSVGRLQSYQSTRTNVAIGRQNINFPLLGELENDLIEIRESSGRLVGEGVPHCIYRDRAFRSQAE